MIVLLWAMTCFNVAIAFIGMGLAIHLMSPHERTHWRSQRLLRIADVIAWVVPFAAVAGTLLAWSEMNAGRAGGALYAFLSLAWLIVMGIVFAVVDFAEDGILGNARDMK